LSWQPTGRAQGTRPRCRVRPGAFGPELIRKRQQIAVELLTQEKPRLDNVVRDDLIDTKATYKPGTYPVDTRTRVTRRASRMALLLGWVLLAWVGLVYVMNKVDDAIPAITTAKIEQSGSGIFLRVVGINLENGPAGLTVVCAGRRVAFQAVTIEDEGLAVRVAVPPSATSRACTVYLSKPARTFASVNVT
jgi:hypothetical protein